MSIASSIAGDRHTDGRLELFYIGTDGHLFHIWQNSPNGGWASEEQLPARATSLAMGRNADGRLEVFYIGIDNNLYHNWQTAPSNGWSGQSTFGGQAKVLAVGRNADGRLEVFYIGIDDNLYHSWQIVPNGGWAGGQPFGGKALYLAVGRNADGRLEVFYIGIDNNLYHNWQTAPSNGWSGEYRFEGQAKSLTVGQNADGRLELFYFGREDNLYHNWQITPSNGWAGEHLLESDNPLFIAGRRIFDPSAGVHINDHCFVRGLDGTWHMFGIEAPNPGYLPLMSAHFVHATANQLTLSSWQKQTPALIQDVSESQLWAPHVVAFQGLYYMFYCSGGFDHQGNDDRLHYGISLATSPDLWTWTRFPRNPLFQDGYQARDPMVMWNPVEGHWVMYYCATDPPSGGNHVVAYRTSGNLIDWSLRAIAYVDAHLGTEYGPTESPFVVQRGEYYYLFIGPRPYDPPTLFVPNWRHPGYDGTDVFRSRHWDRWTDLDYVGHAQAHAAEIVRDVNGDWYISTAGIKRGGLYLIPLHWRDGLDNEKSSL